MALGAPLFRRAQPLEEVLEAFHPARDPPAREPRHGRLEIASREQLVRHRAEQLLGLQRVEALRAVPARIADVAKGLVEARGLVGRHGHRQLGAITP